MSESCWGATGAGREGEREREEATKVGKGRVEKEGGEGGRFKGRPATQAQPQGGLHRRKWYGQPILALFGRIRKKTGCFLCLHIWMQTSPSACKGSFFLGVLVFSFQASNLKKHGRSGSVPPCRVLLAPVCQM